MSDTPLEGFTVVGFESRMSDTTADLIEQYGGEALPAPSMQEAPLEEHDAVFDFADELLAGEFDIVFFNTGVGTRMLFDTMALEYDLNDVRAALADTVVVARGPKPSRELTERDITIDLKVPEPNTWKEALELLTESPDTTPLAGKRLAIQEYGEANEQLNDALREAGADLYRVPIYRWELPDDLQPLKNGIRALIGGKAQIALFTSRQQVVHMLQVAAEEGWEDALRTALHEDAMVASVGPVTSKKLKDQDLPVDFEPDRPKLAILVKGMAEYAPEYFRQPV
jgi:uroporphyrinogen-III synthase